MKTSMFAVLACILGVVAGATAQDAGSTQDLSVTLKRWLACCEGESQYEDAFVQHRNALATKYPDLTTLAELDSAMMCYPDQLPTLSQNIANSADKLLRVITDMHHKKEAVGALLPYLMMLDRNAHKDLRIQYCILEGWCEQGRAGSMQAVQAVGRLAEVCQSADARTLESCLGSLGCWGGADGAAASFQKAVAKVQGDLVAKKVPPQPLAIILARRSELEDDLQVAMVNKKAREARSVLEMMWNLDKSDWAARFLAGGIDGSRKHWPVGNDIHELLKTAEGRQALAAGLQRLGFPQTAERVSVGAEDYTATAVGERDAFMQNGNFRILGAGLSENGNRQRWGYAERRGRKQITGIFFRKQDGSWREEKSDNVSYDFIEVGTNSEYVELKCRTEQKWVRLFAAHAEIKMHSDPTYTRLHFDGHWQ